MGFFKDINEINRQKWLKKIISKLPKNLRILDAGAGELKNRKYCTHLDYVSQDFGQYKGSKKDGLHNKKWDTSEIDIVSDICKIPQADASFDAILCSEVLEHVPDPIKVLDEFHRLLKLGGKLIITAPFSSNVHMAPYYYYSGFSKYWYEHHLQLSGFKIETLVANGDWYSLLRQEITRLGSIERKNSSWTWPISYGLSFIGLVYFFLRPKKKENNLACFGWQCVAVKNNLKNKY
jgi:ubiquinone/menaquinone biosynthesis C-methylase UbiE